MTAHDKSDVNVERHERGFYVITQRDACEVTPLCCPVCSAAMRTREDDVSYREFQCCERCASLWAYAHREEWKDGWRPPRDDIDVANTRRLPLSIELSIK